ncbi:MAG: PAS domain-containing protein [Eubacteriaceae bacterium]|nr:PAS domain-containing protein [Eubacteriaceae bacterium]
MIALGELRKLLDRLPYGAGLFTSEGEGAFKYFNDNYYRLTGYSRGEYAALDGDDINKLIYPPDISKISDMAELLRHEDHAVSDCRIIQKNGRINRISIDASRIELKEYPVLLICFRAVTEETCSQTLTDHLALEQERYRLILERAHALIIELNCVTGEFYTSESFNDYAMADIDSDVLFSGQAAQDTVHPDDVHILRSFFDSKLEPDKNSDCLLRLKMKDGSYRWSRMFGTLTKDSDGNPLRAIAAIMEVNNTTESSVIIKNLVEAMPGGIAVFKAPPHTECMYINDAILDMIDYTRDELMDLINKNGDLRSMVYPEDRAVFDVEISEQAKNGAPINCDLRYYTGTGKHIEWIHISAVRIRENMDNPLYYCILSRPSEESKIFRQISHDSVVAELALEYPSGKVLYGNRAFRDLAGIPEHISLTGYELKGLMDRRDYNDITACSNAIQKKGSIDTMLTTSSGKTLQLQGRTMDWVGKNTSLFYFSDQTAVQQHNEWLINIINSVPVGMGIYEIHSDRIQQLYLNDSFYKMLGDTRENRSKFFDYSYLDAIHPEDVHLFNESISSMIAGADHSDITYRVINGEGKYIWFHMVGSVNSTDDDRRIVYCSFFDIDREMTSQLTLRESRQVLHHAMSTAKMYSFRFDVKNHTLSYEEDFQEDYNYGKPVVFDVPDSIIAEGRVHPNSVDDFRSLFCTVVPEDKPLLKDIFIKRSGRGNYRWERIIMTP